MNIIIALVFFCCEKEEEINIYIFGALKSLIKKLITQFYINLKAPKTPHNNQQKKNGKLIKEKRVKIVFLI